MTNGNNIYNNNYFNRLIEFVEKQTTAQIEQKNSAKNIQKTVDSIKNDTKYIIKKITKISAVALAFCGLLTFAWGFVSFSVDKMVQNEIKQYIEEKDRNIIKQEKLEDMIKEILENLRKD